MRIIDADKLKSEVRNAVPLNMDSVYTLINNQPTVNEWIPCSERLPEKTGYYLITYSRKYCQNEMAVGFFSREDYDTDFGNPWEVSTYGDLKEILAWQPLEAPYQESEVLCVKSEQCKGCKYETYRNIMYPCSECSRNEEMEDKYREKEQ